MRHMTRQYTYEEWKKVHGITKQMEEDSLVMEDCTHCDGTGLYYNDTTDDDEECDNCDGCGYFVTSPYYEDYEKRSLKETDLWKRIYENLHIHNR